MRVPATNNAIREASHAGSWYTGDKVRLNQQLNQFLEAVDETKLPRGGGRMIIGPHAGYSYSGPTAAWAYKAWNLNNIKRVFLLGPSHVVYLDGCALSSCKTYKTPLGDLPVDIDTVEALKTSKEFYQLSVETEEEEHSLEMHIPFIYKMTSESPQGVLPIIPIVVGSISATDEKKFARILAPYFANPENAVVISSDFCHWGRRFSYTGYTPNASTEPFFQLDRNTNSRTLDPPIYKGIEYLDTKGMQVSSLLPGSEEPPHPEWNKYLSRTKNTICGRHPIGLLLAALEIIDEKRISQEARGPTPPENDCLHIEWIRYAQSSQVTDISDSSVSYAAGVVVKGPGNQ